MKKSKLDKAVDKAVKDTFDDDVLLADFVERAQEFLDDQFAQFTPAKRKLSVEVLLRFMTSEHINKTLENQGFKSSKAADKTERAYLFTDLLLNEPALVNWVHRDDIEFIFDMIWEKEAGKWGEVAYDEPPTIALGADAQLCLKKSRCHGAYLKEIHEIAVKFDSENCCSSVVLLHELTHALVDDNAHHSQAFVDCFVHLLREYALPTNRNQRQKYRAIDNALKQACLKVSSK